MYIIPYYTRTKKGDITNSISLTVAWVFMKDGGKQIWKTESNKETVETIIKEYLNENGLYGSVKCVLKNTLFYEIDTEKTKLDTFYRWLEDGVEEGIDVWRPWFLLSGINEIEYDQIKVLREDVLKI